VLVERFNPETNLRVGEEDGKLKLGRSYFPMTPNNAQLQSDGRLHDKGMI